MKAGLSKKRTGNKKNFLPVTPAFTTAFSDVTSYQTTKGGLKSIGKKWFGRKNPIGNPVESAEQWGLMQAVARGTARVKGITKAVARKFIRETPPELRSEYAKELARRKRNPDDIGEAEEISRDWHGRDVREEYDIEEIEHYDEAVAHLADLEELGILGPDLEEKFLIRFKKDRPKVCAPNRKNIEFIGGDQHLDLGELDLSDSDDKKMLPLGYSYQIVYEADKHHLQGSTGVIEPYEHFWGEEFYKENGLDQDAYESSDDFFDAVQDEGLHIAAIEAGILPMVVYDTVNEKILLVGGKYDIRDVGIVN